VGLVGKLVKEDCSVPSQARVGAITKSTRYDVGHLESYNSYDDDILPGNVVTVTWQCDATRSIYVFYGGSRSSGMSLDGGNAVEILEC